jgi:hypothetical protein
MHPEITKKNVIIFSDTPECVARVKASITPNGVWRTPDGVDEDANVHLLTGAQAGPSGKRAPDAFP